jgi:hypothetical protein
MIPKQGAGLRSTLKYGSTVDALKPNVLLRQSATGERLSMALNRPILFAVSALNGFD